MNIILCGLPGVGKTTIGKQLAQKLERPFIDTDVLIEQLIKYDTGKEYSCRQIFKHYGESRFRDYESQVISSLIKCQSCVIAIGGGSLLLSCNVKVLKTIGVLVYLETRVEKLQHRIPIYEKAADITWPVTRLEKLFESPHGENLMAKLSEL